MEQRVATLDAAETGGFRDRARQQGATGDLGVERLRRGDAHLDIATVRRVQDAVGLVDQVAPAAVDDPEHRCTTAAQQVDRAVGVGGGSALADGDRERVAHVEAHAEPRQLGRRDGVDVEAAVAQLVEDRRRALAGDRGGALPDDTDPRDGAGRQPRRDRIGERPGADLGVQDAVALDDLAAQRLAEALGCLADLLPEVVRGVAAVDVAGGDLGGDDLVLADGHLGAVVPEAADGATIAAVCAVEHDDLAAVLAVEAEVAARLLDQAVRLAGDDVAVVGEPDGQALATPAQREQQRVRRSGAGGADGDGAVERRDRAPERLDERVPGERVTGDQRRDHLGIGGDLAMDAQPVLDPQVGVVVDVAIERGHDVRTRVLAATPFELLAVERMGVGLGDDADTRPARVPEHGDLDIGRGQRTSQHRILGDGGAEHAGVVAELADLGGRLVDERQAAVDPAHRLGLVQRIRAPPGQQPGDTRVGFVEPVVPHEQVESGGVAAADLEPVDRRQRPLDGEVAGHRANRRVATGEQRDLPGGAQPVVTDRPRRITQGDKLGARRLDLVDADDPGFDLVVDLVGEGLELVEPALDPGHQLVMVGEGEETGQPAQPSVDVADGHRDRGHVGTRPEGGVESGDDLVGGRNGERRGTAHDADDAAHGFPGY